MALGNYVGVIGGLFGAFKGFSGSVAKWLGVVGLGAVAVEQGTKAVTGEKTGVVTNLFRDPTQAAAVETSRLQAVDSLFDMVSGASNGISTFVSGTLATILEAIAHFTGSETMANWAAKCRSFENRMQDVHTNRADQSRQNGADGNLGAPGADPTIPATENNNASPTGLTVTQGLAVAGATGGAALLARSAINSGRTDQFKAQQEKLKAERAAMSPQERMQADMDAEHAKRVNTVKATATETAEATTKTASKATMEVAEEALESGAKKGWLRSIASAAFGKYGKAFGTVTSLGLGGLVVADTMTSSAHASELELPKTEGQTVETNTVTSEAVQTQTTAMATLPESTDAGLGHRIMVSADAVKDGAGNFVGNTLGLVHWAGNGIGGWFGNDNIMPDAMSGENLSKAINNTTDFVIYDVAGASTKAAVGFMDNGLEGAWDAATTRYKPEIIDQTDASLHSNISLGTELGLGVAAVAFTGGAASAGLAGTFANAANASRVINTGVKAARFTTSIGIDITGNNLVASNALAHRMP